MWSPSSTPLNTPVASIGTEFATEAANTMDVFSRLIEQTLNTGTTNNLRTQAQRLLKEYIEEQRLPTTLLDGDYQAQLRIITPIYQKLSALKDIQKRVIIIQLLALLKRKSPLKSWYVFSDRGIETVDELVTDYINAWEEIDPSQVIALIGSPSHNSSSGT